MIVIVALMIALSSTVLGEPLPKGNRLIDVPHGECWRYWQKSGLRSDFSAPGKSYSFDHSLSESYAQYYTRINRKRCWKEWLIVIYMAADNDLEPYSFRDLWEMEAALPAPSVDTVVFHDGFKKDGTRYIPIAHRRNKVDIDQEFKRFLRVHELEGKSPQEKDEAFWESEGPRFLVSPSARAFAEEDSGDVKTLATFLKWAISNYPSRRIMLIGWSHGEGFDAVIDRGDIGLNLQLFPRTSGRQGGFAFDKTPRHTHMAVTEMVKELRGVFGKQASTNPIDIVGSDACLNQQWEFAREWHGLSDYIFGSSTIVQKRGFNYRTLLNWFVEHPSHSTHDLAKEIPRLYGGSAGSGAGKTYSSYYDPYSTMAVWQMDKLIYVQRAMEDLGMSLLDWIEQGKDAIDKTARIEDIKKHIEATRVGGVSNDLLNFLQSLGTWARDGRDKAAADNKEKARWDRLIREINATRRVLNDSVIAYYIGSHYYYKKMLKTSLGVATWLPVSRQEYRDMFAKFSVGISYRRENEPKQLNPWALFVRRLYE